MQIEFPVSQQNIDDKELQECFPENNKVPQKYQEPELKTSYTDTFNNYLKSFIGSGIIAIPYTFAQSGLVLSIFITILIAFLVNFSLVVLVQVQEYFKQPNYNYSDLVEHTFGKNWRTPVIIQIYLIQAGACISYIIFFMQFINFAVYGEDGTIDLNHQIIYGMIALIIILPTIFFDNMTIYSHLSVIANILIGFSLSVIIYYACVSYMNNREKIKYFNISQVSTIIGVSLFSFAAPEMVLSLRNSMNNPIKFKRLLQLVNFYASALTLLFGVICSLGFGEGVQQIVLFSLPSNNIFISIVQICYAISLALSFPLQLMPALAILESVDFVKNNINGQIWRKNIIRVIQTILICFIATIVPSFADFLSLIGSLTGSIIQFLLPLLMYRKTVGIKDTYQFIFITSTRNKMIINIIMIIGTIISIYSAIMSLVLMIT